MQICTLKGLQLFGFAARMAAIVRLKYGTAISFTYARDVTSSLQWLAVAQMLHKCWNLLMKAGILKQKDVLGCLVHAFLAQSELV